MARQTGATTKQIEAAPKGAVFVWCNGHTDYASLSGLPLRKGNDDNER